MMAQDTGCVMGCAPGTGKVVLSRYKEDLSVDLSKDPSRPTNLTVIVNIDQR